MLELFILITIMMICYFVRKKHDLEEFQDLIKKEKEYIEILEKKRTQYIEDALSVVKKDYEKELAGIERLSVEEKLERLKMVEKKYIELQLNSALQYAMFHANVLEENISAGKKALKKNIRKYNAAIV